MPSRTSRPPARRTTARRRLPGRSGLATAVAAAGAAALAAATPAFGETLLAQGSSGPAVSRVQSALHTKVTGRFGSATRKSVLAFQRRDGLMRDGVVGPQTWDALFGITPPAPTPVPSAPPATASGAPAPGFSGGYSIPSGIVQCESGGDYGAVNTGSGAGGAYQILPSTWRAYGGAGLPQDASPAEQDRIAAQIYAQQGASAWSC